MNKLLNKYFFLYVLLFSMYFKKGTKRNKDIRKYAKLNFDLVNTLLASR